MEIGASIVHEIGREGVGIAENKERVVGVARCSEARQRGSAESERVGKAIPLIEEREVQGIAIGEIVVELGHALIAVQRIRR